jgi:hypothetical protein
MHIHKRDAASPEGLADKGLVLIVNILRVS